MIFDYTYFNFAPDDPCGHPRVRVEGMNDGSQEIRTHFDEHGTIKTVQTFKHGKLVEEEFHTGAGVSRGNYDTKSGEPVHG